MAKGFPYFKFVATEWLTGDIVFEDYELQGIFINVCAIYWHRNGDVTIDEVEKRLKTVRLNSLSPRFISVNEGKITIDFLDEQLIAANYKSKVNSGNGKLGGRPKTQDKKPNAKRTQTERKAKKTQEEEEIEKEKDIYRMDYILNIFIKKQETIWTDSYIKKEAEKFYNFYSAKDWMIGKNKIKSMPHAVAGWINRANEFGKAEIKAQPMNATGKTPEQMTQQERDYYGF